MVILGALLVVLATGFLCWLLFTLATYALPALSGVVTTMWAYQVGVGLPGSILVGLVCAGPVFGGGQFLLTFARPMWAKLVVALAFVAPSAIAGFHATHGIVKHLMPSEAWQTIFSVIGAIAVSVTAFVRVTSMAPSEPTGQTPASV